MDSNLYRFMFFLSFRQLQNVAPNHAYLQDLDLKSSLFDRAAQRFAVA